MLKYHGRIESTPVMPAVIVVLGLMLFCGTAATTVNASGFALYTHGARELGRINSVVASPEGPVSSFFNPATLSELPGNQIEAGTVFIFPSVKFKSASTGKTKETKSQVFFPSTLFGAYHLNDTFTLGIGINSPFGLGTQWPENWEGRYITTNAEMETFLFNPNLAWKVTDTLTLAGGVDFLLGDSTLECNINLSSSATGLPFSLPDVKQKFSGDGYGWGYNLGVLWKIKKDLSLGISYRSGIDLELEGDVTFSDVDPLVAANFQNTRGEAEVNLPPQIFTGLAYQVNDNLVVEIGGRWEGWSRYKELRIDFDQQGIPPEIIPKNWKDTLTFNTGVRYSVDPTLDILLGYLYEDNPVPDDTFEPSVPASEKHMWSIGAAKRFGSVNTAITYLYGKYNDRDKTNVVGAEFGLNADGEYEQDTHMLGMSVNVEF